MQGACLATQCAANSRLLASAATAQTAPYPGVPDRESPNPLSLRIGVKSGDFCALALACTPVQAAAQRFELIPIALQRGCVEIVNTFLGLSAKLPAVA